MGFALCFAAAARGSASDYVDRWLTALKDDQDRRERRLHPSALDSQSLSEPVTDQELEVLRLVASGQSNEAMAETLVTSIETVKKHLKNIFGFKHIPPTNTPLGE